MRLNTLKPAAGARKERLRVGRGIGPARARPAVAASRARRAPGKGKIKVGFEGGQMPLQRRLPKFGFRSKR